MMVHPEVKSAVHELIVTWGLVDVLRALEEDAAEYMATIKKEAEEDDCGDEYADAYQQVLAKIETARQTAEFVI